MNVHQQDSGSDRGRKREGRRNSYTVHPEQPLRAAQAGNTQIGDFVAMLIKNEESLALAS